MSDNYGARCKRCDIRQPACCGMCTVCVSNLEAENEKYAESFETLYTQRPDDLMRIKNLEAENAKLKEAAQAVVDDANIEPDTGWELPSYCHVERSEILALAALVEGGIDA